MASVLTADGWIYNLLKNDATVHGYVGDRIYVDMAPVEVVYPLVVYQFISGRPLRGVGPHVMYYDETWQIKAVIDKGSYATVGALINHIRTLTDAVADTGILSCEEVQTFRFSEYENGNEYTMIGLELLIRTQ